MSRRAVVFCVILSLVAMSLSLGIALSAPKGAVHLSLSERDGTELVWNQAGNGPVVGWAIANTTGAGALIVQIHLDNGAPDRVLDVYVKVNVDSGYVGAETTMETNRQGKGNGHVVLDVSEEPGDAVLVQVVVKKPEHRWLRLGYASAYLPVPKK